MQSGELQRRAASDAWWLAGKAEKGGQRGVECGGAQLGMQWGLSSGRHGLRRAMVGWYLPVLVVDEKRLSRNVCLYRPSLPLIPSPASGHIEQVRGYRQVVAERCWWRGRGSGGGGQCK